MFSFYSRLILLSLLLFNYSPAQESLPPIPASARILTLEEVQNYWVNQLSKKPLPKKPTGLHPEKQAQWRTIVAQRNSFIASIQAGQCKTRATLAQLRHNSAAYTALKQDDKAKKTTAQLQDLEVHLENIKTLRLQQEAARKELADSKKLDALQNRIDQLESQLSQSQYNSYSSAPAEHSQATKKSSTKTAKGSPAKK